MILAVCLNPALDITYRTATLRPGASHPVEVVGDRAGGKGINVARVLHQMGVRVTVTGLLGGGRAGALEADLDAAGLTHSFSAIAEQGRRTVAVVDAEDATIFNEPGPSVSTGEWRRFLTRYRELLEGASAVTMSGSTPPGLEAIAYATLIQLARVASVPVVLDAGGPALRHALGARPTIVAPNRAETAAALGRSIDGVPDASWATAELRARGAETVVVSSGADGLVCRTAIAAWFARPARRVTGNPTGAGDALTAALTAGLVLGEPWPTVLRTGIGWAAGAVAAECAGEIDEQVAAEVGRDAVLEELP